MTNPKQLESLEMKEQFYNDWWYLEELIWPIKNLCIEVVKVDPKTRKVEDDSFRNTHIEYWLETGPDEKIQISDHDAFMTQTHDPVLDCGGDSFEEAIIKLTKLVKNFYPNPHDPS